MENAYVNDDEVVDLVLDKPMVVRVKIAVENAEALTPGQLNQTVDVRLAFQGTEVLPKRQPKVSDLLTGQLVDFFPPDNLPNALGDFPILVTVIDEADGINQASRPVEVKDTKGLYIAHVPVDYGGLPSNFDETVDNGTAFLLGVYPISPNEFLPPKKFPDNAFKPLPLNDRKCREQPPGECMVRDLWRLFEFGRNLSKEKADRVVGVLPLNSRYFIDKSPNGCDLNGITLVDLSAGGLIQTIIPAVLVKDQIWLAEAHEIGHTYNLPHEYDENDLVPTKPDPGPCDWIPRQMGETATGFWVDAPAGEDPERDSIGFMGHAPFPDPTRTFDRWTSDLCYNQLFDKFKGIKL